jgi:hypothetical protein
MANRRRFIELNPDLMLLDINMPRGGKILMQSKL